MAAILAAAAHGSSPTFPGAAAEDGFTWRDFEPSFSASGHLVVYGHWDRCDPRTPDGIYAIRSDGSGRRLIWRATSEVELPGHPAFSPSGRLLAFSAEGGPTFITSFRRPDRELELSMSVERYELHDQPAWSSTGRLALMLGGLYRDHIGTVTPGGNNLRLVTRSIRDAMPDWSPTGDRIVFQREKDVGRTIRADVLTAPARPKRHRRPLRLTATRDAYFPVWSPDGRSIAYVRAPGIAKHQWLAVDDARPRRGRTTTHRHRCRCQPDQLAATAAPLIARAPIGTQPRDPPAVRPVPR